MMARKSLSCGSNRRSLSGTCLRCSGSKMIVRPPDKVPLSSCAWKSSWTWASKVVACQAGRRVIGDGHRTFWLGDEVRVDLVIQLVTP
jgi:hypothetical protein